MDAATLQEFRGLTVAMLTLVNMASPGGPSVPIIMPINGAEGDVEEAPEAEQVMEEAGQMAEGEEIAEEEEQAEQEVPQQALEEEGEAVPEVPQQAVEELGPAVPEVQQEAGQDLPQAEEEMQQPALEEAEQVVPEMDQHPVEEDQDVVDAVLERIGHVVEEAAQVEPFPVQSVPMPDQIVLLDGQELAVTGHALIPDNQVIQDDAELMVGQQDKITVSAVYETDSGLVVQMLGVVKVRLGSVTVSADDVTLDGELVLPNEALILMQPGQTLLMSGTLVVQQGGVVTVGGNEMVKVGGLLEVTPGLMLRVRADVGPVTGTVRINPEQVVQVAGRMRAHASQKVIADPYGKDRLRDFGEEADFTSLEDTATASTSQYGVGIVSTTHQEGEVPSISSQDGDATRASSEDDEDTSSSVDEEFEMDMEEQQEECEKDEALVACPLSKIEFKHCDWCNTLSTVADHVRECHADILRKGHTFQCKAVENTALLILYKDEVFLYYKRFGYTGHMFAFVQQVGLTKRKYKCRIRIHSRGQSSDIDKEFVINRITETFEAAVHSGRCISVDAENMGHFVSNYELDMTVILKEFRKRKWTERDDPTLPS